MRTFTPQPAPAPEPVRWPALDDVVLVTDGDMRQGKARVTAVVDRGEEGPAVQVENPNPGLRLPVSGGGRLKFSSIPVAYSWRWPG